MVTDRKEQGVGVKRTESQSVLYLLAIWPSLSLSFFIYKTGVKNNTSQGYYENEVQYIKIL